MTKNRSLTVAARNLFTRIPFDIRDSVKFVGKSGEGEKQVAKAVEIDEGLIAEGFLLHQRNEMPFSPAGDGSCHMQLGGGDASSREYEAGEGRELLGGLVDLLFKKGDFLDANALYLGGVFGIERGCQV